MSDTTNAYTLRVPITRTFKGPDGERDETITQVTVRPPTAGDLRVMDTAPGDVGKVIALISKLTGLDIRTVDKMDAVDFGEVGKLVQDFIPDGLQTGTTP